MRVTDFILDLALVTGVTLGAALLTLLVMFGARALARAGIARARVAWLRRRAVPVEARRPQHMERRP